MLEEQVQSNTGPVRCPPLLNIPDELWTDNILQSRHGIFAADLVQLSMVCRAGLRVVRTTGQEVYVDARTDQWDEKILRERIQPLQLAWGDLRVTLDLRRMPITSRAVGSLGLESDGMHGLYLNSCGLFTDVSMLGHVHTLFLSYCRGVRDVSMLGNIHTLALSGCPIKDVSDLGDVYRLHLSNCSRLTNVSMLGGVHTLDLSGCYSIKDVSMLSNVDRLDMAWCNSIPKLSVQGDSVYCADTTAAIHSFAKSPMPTLPGSKVANSFWHDGTWMGHVGS